MMSSHRQPRTKRLLLTCLTVAVLLVMTTHGVVAQPRGGDDQPDMNGGGTEPDASRQQEQTSRDQMIEWEGLMLPPGVEGEVITSGLSFPTAIEWDDEGRMHVSLVGFAPEGRQVFRFDNDTRTSLDLSGADLSPQILDITFHEGDLYLTTTGRIHVYDPDNDQARTIVRDLPAWGDHRTDEIAFGPDGRLYVGLGTVTNSGVVGFDQLGQPNSINNVSGERPEYRDIPCADVRLSGWNWNTTNPRAVDTDLNADQGAGEETELVRFDQQEDVRTHVERQRNANATPATERSGLWLTWPNTSAERVVTGPFSPFGTPTYRGQVIEGQNACNGSVLSMQPDGSDLRPVAWGFRNPFALKFDEQGRLWVADNGPDQRGSRPLGPGPDTIQIIENPGQGGDLPFYGWPDHTVGYNYTHPFFTPMFGPPVVPVFAEPPSEPLVQFTWTGAHASSNKFAFGPANTTYEGSILSAEFGSLGSSTQIGALSGMAVTRIDMETGRVTDFITGADRWSGGFRPVEAAFGPDGRLYVVEFGEVGFEEGDGNETHGERYVESFSPETGRILAFTLPDQMDWQGQPVGNPGGQGQYPTGGEYGPRRSNAERVNVFDFGFTEPDRVEVGTPVTFANVGLIGHTATEERNRFNSGFELAPRSNFTWTPTEPGTYTYYCAVHPVMRGSITVLEEGALEEQRDNQTDPEDGDDEATPGPAPMLAIGGLLIAAAAARRRPDAG